MGRSKFPGKPSKLINRKRISVLQLEPNNGNDVEGEVSAQVSSSGSVCDAAVDHAVLPVIARAAGVNSIVSPSRIEPVSSHCLLTPSSRNSSSSTPPATSESAGSSSSDSNSIHNISNPRNTDDNDDEKGSAARGSSCGNSMSTSAPTTNTFNSSTQRSSSNGSTTTQSNDNQGNKTSGNNKASQGLPPITTTAATTSATTTTSSSITTMTTMALNTASSTCLLATGGVSFDRSDGDSSGDMVNLSNYVVDSNNSNSNNSSFAANSKRTCGSPGDAKSESRDDKNDNKEGEMCVDGRVAVAVVRLTKLRRRQQHQQQEWEGGQKLLPQRFPEQQRRRRKFRNLKINRPEIILPSSSRIQRQQREQQCGSEKPDVTGGSTIQDQQRASNTGWQQRLLIKYEKNTREWTTATTPSSCSSTFPTSSASTTAATASKPAINGSRIGLATTTLITTGSITVTTTSLVPSTMGVSVSPSFSAMSLKVTTATGIAADTVPATIVSNEREEKENQQDEQTVKNSERAHFTDGDTNALPNRKHDIPITTKGAFMSAEEQQANDENETRRLSNISDDGSPDVHSGKVINVEVDQEDMTKDGHSKCFKLLRATPDKISCCRSETATASPLGPGAGVSTSVVFSMAQLLQNCKVQMDEMASSSQHYAADTKQLMTTQESVTKSEVESTAPLTLRISIPVPLDLSTPLAVSAAPSALASAPLTCLASTSHSTTTLTSSTASQGPSTTPNINTSTSTSSPRADDTSCVRLNTTSLSNNNNIVSKQKKTVTFKNVLETSDDKSAVKRFYNPDNRKPLVSIIKKDSRSSDCIVRPSRLTEILKRNNDSVNSSASSTCTSTGIDSDLELVSRRPSFNIDRLQEQQIYKRNISSHRRRPIDLFMGGPVKSNCEMSEESDLEREEGDDEAECNEGKQTRRWRKDGLDDDDKNESDNPDREVADNAPTAPSSTSSTVLNGPLSRVFGNLVDYSEQKLTHGLINFPLIKDSCDNPSRTDSARSKRRSRKDKATCSSKSRRATDILGCLMNKDSNENNNDSNSKKNVKNNDEAEEDNHNNDEDYNQLQLIVDRHFILPKRSTRSSRVIKPNKRLLEDGSILSKPSVKQSLSMTTVGNGSGTVTNQKDIQMIATKTSCDAIAGTVTITPSSSSCASDAVKLSVFPNTINNAFSSLLMKGSNFIMRQPKLQFESLCNSNNNNNHCHLSTHNHYNNNHGSKSITNNYNQQLEGSKAESILSRVSGGAAILATNCSIEKTTDNLASPPTASILNNSANMTYCCAVCSLPIHSKNLLQAAKYGELSCDFCRKFISKIARKALSLKHHQVTNAVTSATKHPYLQCRGNDNCALLPPHKTGHPKVFKKLYKERCSYCWLKKCLQALQLPKVRLNAVLPLFSNGYVKNIEQKGEEKLSINAANLNSNFWAAGNPKPVTDSTAIAFTTHNSLLNSGKSNLKSHPLLENTTFSGVPIIRPALLEKSLFLKNSLPELKSEKDCVKSERNPSLEKEFKCDLKATTSRRQCRDKFSGDREKELLGPMKEETKHLSVVSENSLEMEGSTATISEKRQKIALKGPRVKHVCRSASIVLGQPLALFEDNTETQLKANESNHEKLLEEWEERQVMIQEDTSDKTTVASSQKSRESSNFKVTSVATTTVTTNSCANQMTTYKRLTVVSSTNGPNAVMSATTAVIGNGSEILPSINQPRRKEAKLKCKILISIDFWENYDPAEVCQTGFGLITTESLPQRALCFLCGSAGQDHLYFCACCCEPYHQFCVQDEFNLKHNSLDETFLLNESIVSNSNTTEAVTTPSLINNGVNTAMARLNWLCPRCTVCFTCNMSSGAKVCCQKCQKHYHTTCLGTSKRLLGADRPLICVNCLKCRSCSTTKVTKFVGNLPMCTSCFRLRKRGNYCPICQKCYDDQDFDLKMMECGDCRQWVHAKCEQLTDEQYNLLSTLPESIEFICKRCARKSNEAKERALEWRVAVREEFKTNLMTILKLLSKSRQACSLLKLSPRKQIRCICGTTINNNNMSFTISKIRPKSLQFNSDNDRFEFSQLNASNLDVYEFQDLGQDEDQLHELEANNNALVEENDYINNQKQQQLQCRCQRNQFMKNSALNSFHSLQGLSLVDIKQKIQNDSYVSLAEFNYEINQVINQTNCDELVITYKEILSEQFPWFQNETQACTDALEEDMYESRNSNAMYTLHSMSFNGNNENYVDDDHVNVNGYHQKQEGISLITRSSNDHDNHNQHEDHNDNYISNLPDNLEKLVHQLQIRPDIRICLLCRRSGEGVPNEEARLIYCGHNIWVHTNCAIWSAEVFEEIDGSLQNVHSAIARGRMIKCSVCGNRGATVGCNIKSCGEHYHYPCARSANDCAFLSDKSIYCPQHSMNIINESKVPHETQFEVNRPVYVELERKRKRLFEPNTVKFHIGSLEVRQLGHILPKFSDTYEALIPINFVCARLYWSTKEPWRLIEYTLRTTIQNFSTTSSTLTYGRRGGGGGGGRSLSSNGSHSQHFTVDHSVSNSKTIQRGLAQIARWHHSLQRDDCSEAAATVDGDAVVGVAVNTFVAATATNSLSTNSIGFTSTGSANGSISINNSGNATTTTSNSTQYNGCNGLIHNDNTTLVNNDEEPQNNADLLPPEIKDAIFEDLPHELLDGISMLDIFNKCMNYEEISNIGEHSKDSTITDDDTITSLGLFGKHLSPDLNIGGSGGCNGGGGGSTTYDEPTVTLNSISNTQAAVAKLHKLKKTSSPLVNCDNNAMVAIKRRKFSEGMLLTLNHQQRTHKKDNNGNLRRNHPENLENTANKRTPFTWSAEKRYSNDYTSIDSSKVKLVQVDGVDDTISEYHFLNGVDTTTVTLKCERCSSTFRNYEMFQRHLPSCEASALAAAAAAAAASAATSNVTPASSDSEIIDGGGNSSTLTAGVQQATTLTVEQLQELNTKFAVGQRQTPLPFIQTIPAQSISQLGTLQAALPLQLQGVGTTGIQNLQNLQQMQQLTTPQALGSNFFISTQPSINSNPTGGSDEALHLYTNTLQGLTANLSTGGFTITPSAAATAAAATAFTGPVVSNNAAQPQLIAVSTNLDGSQQIIQIPAATNSAVPSTVITSAAVNCSTPTYQTLQATNTDKKIVVPLSGGKLLKTMATKAAQQATISAKGKWRALGVGNDPIKTATSKVNVTPSNQITQHNSTSTVNPAQILNQQLIHQLQQVQQQSNSGVQQPQLLFQATPNNQNQPQIIMQQQPQNIISFVTTTNDGGQPSQLQYVTLPTGTAGGDFSKPAGPAIFTATAAANTPSILPPAYIQTDANGSLVLTNNATTNTAAPALQLLTAAPQAPHVIGTLIQPQALQIGPTANVISATAATGTAGTAVNNTTHHHHHSQQQHQHHHHQQQQQQQQVIINGATTGTNGSLELLSAGAPQVILATTTQPMYYGLETIVQNTVMSSQQFVSTAMPGVLSQNASFSATTTQVFQASKIEPLVDIPTGYVLLNNVDATGATTAILQPQAATTTHMQAQNQSNGTATGASNQPNFIQTALQQQVSAATFAEQQQQQQAGIPIIGQVTASGAFPALQVTQQQQQKHTEVANFHHQQQESATAINNGAVEIGNMNCTNIQLTSAKVTPVVSPVKRMKTMATPVTTLSKVQPHIINKVIPNTNMMINVLHGEGTHVQKNTKQILATSVQHHHPTSSSVAATTSTTMSGIQTLPIKATLINLPTKPPQLSQPQGQSNQGEQQQITTIKLSPNNNGGYSKKSNIARLFHKAEVKPKIGRTTSSGACTIVTKALPVAAPSTPLNTTINFDGQQIASAQDSNICNGSIGSMNVQNVCNKRVSLKHQIHQQQQLQSMQETTFNQQRSMLHQHQQSSQPQQINLSVIDEHHQQPLIHHSNTQQLVVGQQQQIIPVITASSLALPSSSASSQSIVSTAVTTNSTYQLEGEHMDRSNNFIEYVNLQQLPTNQQHYNVADALLLDDNTQQLPLQQLSHCSFEQQQEQQQQPAVSIEISNNILPTIQRMPTYTNINIVNPLQQNYSNNNNNNTTIISSNNTPLAMVNSNTNNLAGNTTPAPMITTNGGGAGSILTVCTNNTSVAMPTTTTVTVTRPTNRVLPMQQKQHEPYQQQHNNTLTSAVSAPGAVTAVTGIINTVNNVDITVSSTNLMMPVATTPTTTIATSATLPIVSTVVAMSPQDETRMTKIAYEAEVKQMLLHSPSLGSTLNELQEEQPQQQQNSLLQQLEQQKQQYQHQQQHQHMDFNKNSDTPLVYEIRDIVIEKSTVTSASTITISNVIDTPHHENMASYLMSADNEKFNNDMSREQVVNSGGEVTLNSTEEEHYNLDTNRAHLSTDSVVDDTDELSVDSDDPTVKAKISKILDNLTNEDCADSLTTPTTSTMTMSSPETSTVPTMGINSNSIPDRDEDPTNFISQQPKLAKENVEINLNNIDNNTNKEHQYINKLEMAKIVANSPNFLDSEEKVHEEMRVMNNEKMEKEQQQEKENKMIDKGQEIKGNEETLLLQKNLENMMMENDLGLCKKEVRSKALPNDRNTLKANMMMGMAQSGGNYKLVQASPAPPSYQDPSQNLSGPHLLYEIQSEDGFTYKSTSITEIWEKVFEAVQVARRVHGLAPLPEGPLADMNGIQMLGLKTNALKYLIEQLPGVEKCTKYTPKYHNRHESVNRKNVNGQNFLSTSVESNANENYLVNDSICLMNSRSKLIDSSSVFIYNGNGERNATHQLYSDYFSDQEDYTENVWECARCEPFSRRSEYDMFSWLASRHRQQPVQVFLQPMDNELVPRRGTGSNLPMAMKYRTLKETYKDYVGVFRSQIHGRGLYCTKDIEAGEMVIEYAGELIRSTLTDLRERYYNSRGIGCYMFKIDDHLVVDATMRGNAARFINHSCEPNCYSKVVDILGHKHIIIFALRRIVQGEELTYDYKFPFEDEKIPCSCGSKKCRKYLN